jgi:hypothetical protein
MAIEIYCIRGSGDKEKSPVSDSLLSSENAAVERGKYEINKQWYFIHSQVLKVPFKKANDSTMIMDDDIVSISDSKLGISGNRKVKDITISGNVSEVKMSLNLEKFEEYL